MKKKSRPQISEIKKFTLSKQSVRRTLMPELDLINDSKLADKVVDAWQLACSLGGYKDLQDVPTEMFERMPKVSNIDHQKGVARIASFLVRGLNDMGVSLNEDYVVAAALCHDLGKPIEWRHNQRGFYSTALGAGTFYGENPNMPRLGKNASFQIARHPVWGLHVAMQVGMPEHVIHMIAAHSMEGHLFLRSREALIVKEADEVWWEQVGYHLAGDTWPDIESPFTKGNVLKYRKLDWRRKVSSR